MAILLSQRKTCFRGVKSTPTEPVRQVCYADGLTVWVTGVKIPDMEDSLNSYPEEITAYMKDTSLLIPAPKSSVTFFTPDTHQAKIHPKILIKNLQLSLVQCPKILGVHLDISLPWGQQKETLLMTYNFYKAVRRSIINYAAPVWSTNLRDTNNRNIQYTQNEALRISSGCHKMSSVDHLHAKANVLKVREHSELLSAQHLARCLEPDNANNSITRRDTPKRRRMKEPLFTRHRSSVEPMMIAKDRK